MPQQATDARYVEIRRANGLNDFVSPLKLEKGFVTAGLNFNADGGEWKRREGRDLYWLSDDNPIIAIASLIWADGTTNYIALADTTFWDITPTFTYYFRNSARWILQAPGGQYWDCTPGFTTGLINPTVVATPSATPQTATLTVTSSESIGFQVDGASVELKADFQHNGWYLQANLDNL